MPDPTEAVASSDPIFLGLVGMGRWSEDSTITIPLGVWVGTGFVLQAGVLKLDYDIRIAGEPVGSDEQTMRRD
jgi:hypothetical protein